MSEVFEEAKRVQGQLFNPDTMELLQAPDLDPALNLQIDENSPGKIREMIHKSLDYLNQKKYAIALSAFAGSVALDFVASPMEEIKNEIVHKGPLVGSLLVGGEAMWIGGAAIALGSVGNKIGWNPLKIRKEYEGIANHANTSKMFKFGFWTNTTAAVAEFGIITGAVLTMLPPRSWGALSLGFADLAATVGFRAAILKGIKDKKTGGTDVDTKAKSL